MALDFAMPSGNSNSGSNLAVSISPLGLVELSDEEFEVHGPRLNRYSLNWAMYLGRHWSYQREAGEPQVTYNWFRAFTDYIATFTFGHGITFTCPKATEAIVPDLLKRVWEMDNDKKSVLWEMAQQGGVSGDCFIKVAYEEGFQDGIGRNIPGRVRVLALNSSHCVDEQTEILTSDGWKKHDQVGVGTQILTVDPVTDEIHWQPMTDKVERHHSGDMYKWTGDRFDALTTDGHRWLAKGRPETHKFATTAQMHNTNSSGTRIVTGGGTPTEFSPVAKYSDEWVELAAWFVTEGSWNRDTAAYICQSETANPEKVARIRRMVAVLNAEGFRITEQKLGAGRETIQWYIGVDATKVLKQICPDKAITSDFLTSLTFLQAEMFYDVLIQADGHRLKKTTGEYWYQDDQGRVDAFQMLAAMLGKRTYARRSDARPESSTVSVYSNRLSSVKEMDRTVEHYDGIVWCPVVEATTWLARRNGVTYWTGNCYPEYHPHDKDRIIRFKLKYRFWGTAPEGTRQVFTYTEVLTDDLIEEYVNDQLIDQRPNPLGKVPVVHISNTLVSGSPWGLADCQDVVALNREYNEKATEISDIINYHAAPITVVLGAKASNLEKGPRKVWAIPTAGADVKNLELGGGIEGPMAYLELLKRSMHEMVGIPETALGQMQPISNTSGVALSIQFQPLMMRFHQKTNQYARGLEKVNELILLTLAVKEPETFTYDPSSDIIPLKDGQLDQLDPADPLTYLTTIHFPPPLPIDKLILLNEIQLLMGIQLESREGALRKLGEEFPEEKLAEIRAELKEDAISDGALQLIKTQIQAEITALTGIMPTPDGGGMLPPMDAGTVSADGSVTGGGPQMPEPTVDMASLLSEETEMDLRNKLVTEAYGTKQIQRRTADEKVDGE